MPHPSNQIGLVPRAKKYGSRILDPDNDFRVDSYVVERSHRKEGLQECDDDQVRQSPAAAGRPTGTRVPISVRSSWRPY